uniref:Putative homing endonuclease n=1 Tax=viral metagenome TaxID=1070528 RepID=A0A6M3LZ09_9ZZZZ
MDIKVDFKAKENDEIFYKPLTANRRYKFIYIICPDCGSKRWIRPCDIKSKRCSKCSSLYNLSKISKGNGKFKLNGYYVVKLIPDHPYFAMAFKNGYILEHRLIMAQQMGRLLTKNEIVHHRDRNKINNIPDNLKLVTRYNHRETENNDIVELMNKVKNLEAENKRLRIIINGNYSSSRGCLSI